MDLNVQDQNERVCENAILDSLFYGCDNEGTGFVKVSKLIEYLSHAVAGENVEFGGSFDELSLLLDPEEKDVQIDIETYRKGIEDWIDDIRCQSYEKEIAAVENSTSHNISRDTTEDTGSLNRTGSKGERSINNSSESVEGVGGESPQKQDWELVTKIEDLQLNNKRLVDHNAELSFQMENTEETNAQLLQEVEKLHKQLRSYQSLDEKNRTIEKENEELRQAVVELQETSKNFQNKAKQLERDKLTLCGFHEDLQAKLSAANSKLESLSNDHKSVCLAYNEEKQKLIELEELRGVKEEIDKESIHTREYLTSVISDLSAQKEALQMEKNKMEAELFQVREDLSRFMGRNSCPLTPTKYTVYATPSRSLTTVSSLHQEIQELSCDDCLPSPLVGYSSFLNESYESDVFESPVKSRSRTSPLSLASLDLSISSSISSPRSNDILAAVNQVAVDFREKKEKALHAISELVKLDKTRETKEIRECLQSELEREMEFFAEKVWLLSLARKASEKRVSKLLASLGILREENKQLSEERDRALQKIGNLSLGSDGLETRVDDLTAELETTLEKVEMLEKRCAELENETSEAKNELQSIKLKNETLASSIEVERNARQEAEKKLQEVEKLRSDLEKERERTLAQISKLERQFERTSMDLAVEKRRSFDLQESLSLSVSKHDQELQDIMETIPNVTYNDQINNKYSKSDSKLPAVTGYQVRTKLKEFFADRHLTIRDSPDGKPTTQNDAVPLGVSTPKDGSDINLHSKRPLHNQLADISLSLMNDNKNSSLSPFSNHESKAGWLGVDKSRDHSWSTPDLCRRPNNPNLSFSDVSPNLIRPFKSGSDIGQSPSLINPFAENCNRNLTFTKDENMQEIREWDEGPLKGNAVALRSFDEKECQGTMDHFANESSPDAVENCAKNLAKDFSGEATQNLSLSASLSSNQYSEDSDETESDDDYRSVPTSSTIHLAARKISNTTRTRKMSVTGDPPPVVQSVPEVVELEAGNGTTSKVLERFSEKKCEQKSIFSFDNLVIERCTRRADGSGVASPLSNSSGDGEHALEGYDSDFRSSSSVINSYIDGVSLNSSLPTDEKELEKLFKSVSLAFRTDKDTLPQRLEYQERARDTAESNVSQSLQNLFSGIKGLKKTDHTNSNKQALKQAVDSLCEQTKLLKESSRRVSSQSHQFGCYQQEARMMSGVDVLINYGENLSQRLETLSDSLSAKELLEKNESWSRSACRDSKRSGENAEEVGQSSRRGSMLINLVTSIRPKDAFSLFGSGEIPKIETTSDDNTRQEAKLGSGGKSQECSQWFGKETETEQVLETITKEAVKERSCGKRCAWWFAKLVVIFVLFAVFTFIVIQHSVIDRDFVVEQIHRNLKRFEVKLYGQEPAV